MKRYVALLRGINISGKNKIPMAKLKIEEMIKNQFGLDIPVFNLSKEELENILKNVPDWWGSVDKDIYDNLNFHNTASCIFRCI